MRYVLVLLLLCGCGTRKVEKTENNSEKINIENNYSMGEKIVLNDVFTYTPADISKPMIIDGKSYKNAILKTDKSVSKQKTIEIKTKYNITKTITVYKTIEKKDNTLLYLGIVLIIGCLVFAWFYLKGINPF